MTLSAKKAAEAVVCELREKYKVAIAAIESASKPWAVQPSEWASQQAAKIAEKRAFFNARGANIDDAIAVVLGPQGIKASRQELEMMLSEQVGVEIAAFVSMRSVWPAGKFGDPLAPVDNTARYEFWPAHAAQFPLLNFCAEVLLGGMESATENERFHSLMSYIMTKLRARMTAATLETLSLCKFTMMKTLKADFAKAKTALELVELAEQHLWAASDLA